MKSAWKVNPANYPPLKDDGPNALAVIQEISLYHIKNDKAAREALRTARFKDAMERKPI